MRYTIVTVQWCKEHGISVPIHARRSLDGSEVILHEDFIKPMKTISNAIIENKSEKKIIKETNTRGFSTQNFALYYSK